MRRIAAVTDDGVTICPHFGRATSYMVIEVEGESIGEGEIRAKPGHHTFASEPHHHDYDEEHKHGHGMGEKAKGRHAQMIAVIEDCEAMLARGMGRGAYIHLEEAGIRPIITDIEDIRTAVSAYLTGEIEDHTERLH